MKKHSREVPQPTHITTFLDIPDISGMPAEEVEWLVEGLIPMRTITLITAPPAGYKTWFALALAKAVSEGEEFLGRPTKCVPALILDRDNPPAVIRDRGKILRLGLNGQSHQQVRIWGNWISDLPPQIDDPRLLEFAEEHHPLIIFDYLRRFHGAEENSAKEMGPVMHILRQLATAGATLVLLHHSTKSGQSTYRGSSDIQAGVDIAFALDVDRKPDPPVITLDCSKHRFTEEFKIKLRLNVDRGGFEVISDTAAEREHKIVATLTRLIRQKPGRSGKKLITLSGLGELTARKALRAGKDVHWEVRKGVKNTKLYYPI